MPKLDKDRGIWVSKGDIVYTHCTKCDYESEEDFDTCPKCKSNGHAVWVLKKGD